jgi:hypothetical protein
MLKVELVPYFEVKEDGYYKVEISNDLEDVKIVPVEVDLPQQTSCVSWPNIFFLEKGQLMTYVMIHAADLVPVLHGKKI